MIAFATRVTVLAVFVFLACFVFCVLFADRHGWGLVTRSSVGTVVDVLASGR